MRPPPAAPATAEPGADDRGDASRRGAGRLGAGLVDIPPVPARDPGDGGDGRPDVAEHRRFCGRCDEPVGRSRDGQPGRTEGFCRGLRNAVLVRRRSSRRATSSPASTRSSGCLAHGGLGWIYLARDHNVVRPVGRAQGPARQRRRARHGGRARRAPVPRRGRAPEHRQDPQLRRARRRRLHRDGVRQRHQPARHARGPAATPTAAGPTRCRSSRRSPTASRSCRRSATSTTSASCSATSSPTT